MSQDVPITPEGLAAIQVELDELRQVRRPDITSKIKAARELGDLSENFEYHSAKNEQGFIESRIAELESIVRNHVLIEAAPANGRVQLGSSVTVIEDGSASETYRIVGPAEADPGAGRISDASALGRVLIGRRAGEEVTVHRPLGGTYKMRIESVR